MTSAANRFTALYPVVGVESPTATGKAFQQHFGLEPVFETDWYVHLKRPESELQIGLVRYDHKSVPRGARRPVEGGACFVTIDADDVAAVWQGRNEDLEILQELTDEEWGQRHFICRLPGGVMVDVVQLLAPAQ